MTRLKKYKILITGSAGFIGFHVAQQLTSENHFCVGVDNLNNYYDKKLKNKRIELLKKKKILSFLNWTFQKITI